MKRHKRILFFLSIILVLIVGSCDISFSNTFNTTETMTTKTSTTKIESTTGTTCSTTKNNTTSSCITTTTYPYNRYNKTHFTDSLKSNGPLTTNFMSSIGSPNVLVVPINFKTSTEDELYEERLEINKAFNGTSLETGFESVKSYYLKSSYNKLNMNFDITQWYTPRNSASYYETYKQSVSSPYQIVLDGTNKLLEEVLTYFDSKYDYSKYDLDKDGYIDAIWLLYNCDVKYSSSSSIYWATTSWDYRELKYDGVKAYSYCFAGTGFMHPAQKYCSYETADILVDAHTYIHETGHLLGLDDYYDSSTTKGPTGGVYGADMMDYNIGDMGAIDKILLGWVDPYVINSTAYINLNSFTDTGDVILVANKNIDSIYTEYFLIEYYTETGLNEHDKPIVSVNGIESKGIRITHIEASQNIVNGVVEQAGTYYKTGFKYNNSDTDYLFINQMLPSSTCVGRYQNITRAFSSSLFTPNTNQFNVNCCLTEKMYDGSDISFSVIVNQLGESANLTIMFN